MTIHVRSGFTFIETLLYIALIGVIMPAVIMLAYSAFSVRSEVRASAVLNENIRFALSRLNATVGEATGITTPSGGTTSSTLILTMATSTMNPTTFNLSGGALTMQQGTGTATTITSSEITISNLTFTRVSSTAPIIQTVFTGKLSNAVSTFPSITVTTTASVRR